jgi:hypothetical protein
MFSPRLSVNLHEASGIIPSSDSAPNALLSSRSMKTSKKKKKLSSKGKAKIAEARAKEALKSGKTSEKETSKSKSLVVISPREEKSKDEKKQKSKKTQLEELKQMELQRLEAEEAARKEKKVQKFTNLMLNAQRSGMKIRDWEKLSLEEKEKKKKGKEKEKGKEEVKLELKEPCEVINSLIEQCREGRQAAFRYLSLENSQKLLHETEFKILKASLELVMKNRQSPINFRIELLWRLAVLLFESSSVLAPKREINLKLSHFAYNLILQHASPDSHPLHYAVLKNSLELCEQELDKLEYQKLMNKNNADYHFEPPKFSETYESEKIVFRMKKPYGQPKNVQTPVVDVEAIKSRKMLADSTDGVQ